MISIDRFEEILGELAEELPAEFYHGLNGGILVEDRHPLHPTDVDGDLYILGEYRIDPAQFCSMGKSTPFAGQTVYGRCVRNVCGGAVVWQDAQV